MRFAELGLYFLEPRMTRIA